MPSNALTPSGIDLASPEFDKPPIDLPEIITSGELSQATITAPDRHMRRNGEAYFHAYANLLPYGIAWPREPDRIIMKVVRGLAEIWGAWVDRRAADLLEIETDPRITLEMLSDWERNWGLPDFCFLGVGQTLDERRRFLLLKMTLLGGQSRAFFIWVAAQLGRQIQITEFAPVMCGVSNLGDTRGIDQSPNLFAGDFGVFP